MAESNSWNNGLNQGQSRGFSGNGSTSGTSGAAIRDAIFDRVPPHDDAAEMAVLGGMLMSKDAIGEVSQMIDITDFYQPRNQTVYEAIINLFSASQPVDAVLVANQLLKDGDLEKVGDPTICTASSHPCRPQPTQPSMPTSSTSVPSCAM